MAAIKTFSRIFSLPIFETLLLKQNIKKSVRPLSTNGPLTMRFLQYKYNGSDAQHLGVQVSPEGDIIEISAVEPSIPNNLVDFLHGGKDMISLAKW